VIPHCWTCQAILILLICIWPTEYCHIGQNTTNTL
jgi:hypothetical protein